MSLDHLYGSEDEKYQTATKIVEYARKGQHFKLVRALAKHKDLVNCMDDQKRSPLFHAAFNGHIKCLKELLKRGANPNQVNISGYTPCHAAVFGGKSPQFPNELSGARNPFTGARLLMKGLRNIVSYHLHDANCQKRCLEYLVCFGGDWKMASKKQETIQEIAIKEQKDSIVELINEYNQFQRAISEPNSEDEQLQMDFNTRYGYWVNSNYSKSDLLSYQSISQTLVRSRVSLNETHTDFPEANPDDIQLVSVRANSKSSDGSVWNRGYWTEGVMVTIRRLANKEDRKRSKAIMCVEYLLKEMEKLRVMHHPNIVLMMGTCTGPLQQDMFQILEPLQISGSLYGTLHHEQMKYSTLESVCIIRDVLEGLVYLHNVVGVAHCLISSHAVQFSVRGCVKLCNVYCSQAPATKIPSVFCAALKMYLPWMAPELMVNRVATMESDMFSVGVLLWELWSTTPPWPGLTPPQLGRVIVRDGQRLPITSKHSLVAPLLKTCFGPPLARLPAAQLLSQVNYLKMVQFYN